MTDYKVNFDVQYFGTDNPATAIAERMPSVVQTDGKLKFVNIGIVSAAHGSHVTGIAAGNSLFGGQMSGAAPGRRSSPRAPASSSPAARRTRSWTG